jgi:TonB-dependent starch-binding outer membrane protein SusC
MRKFLHGCITIFLLFLITHIHAQVRTINGTVISEDSKRPLPGVSVSVKGSFKGTVTDESGNYSIVVKTVGDTLLFSYSGYTTQRIQVGSGLNQDISLIPAIRDMDAVIVVGYGTQKKTEVTSAAVTVKSKDFVQGAVTDAGQLLRGKVAGLTIGTPSGDPGAASQILLRGVGTLFSSTQPLILVDGIPGGLNTVAPQDIESIDVLKDGAAAAIYGTRGTNGVILITTKKSNGVVEPSFTYNGYISTQHFTRKTDVLTAAEYRANKDKWGSTGYQDDGGSTDWIKEISRPHAPLGQLHQFTLKGGNAKTNYLGTIAYTRNEGVIITTENKMVNSRVDVNHSMLNGTVKLNVNFINANNTGSVGFNSVIYRNAERYNPTSPVHNTDGMYFENFGPTENYNPVAMLKEQFGNQHSQSTRISGSLTWTPVKELRLKMLASGNKFNSVDGYGQTKKHYSNTAGGRNGFASKNDFESIDQLVELTADYSKTIQSHKFNAIAGYSYQENQYQRAGMSNYDFPVGNYSYIDNIGLGNALKTGEGSMFSRKEASNLIGFFGRLTYSYKERYLLMASVRREAASQLVGTSNPWGTFPAVSVGWRLSEETFIKEIAFIDNLKIRAGYGVTGTSPGALFLAVPRIGYSGLFLVNGVWQPSVVPISNPNENLKWEEKRETNIGLDYSFLKGRINGSIDYYKRKTVGLLFDYQVPSPPNLYPTTKANVGVMENKGIEILVNVIPIQAKNFTWSSTLTYSKNKNKLVSLENDLYKVTNPFFDIGRTPTPIGDISHRVAVGEPIGNFWGYKVLDITDDGHWVYEDGEGKPITTKPNPAKDRKIIGNGLPTSYASWNNTVSYRNFDLGITMRGAFGFQIINSTRLVLEVPSFSNYNVLNSSFAKVFGKSVLNKDVSPELNSYYVEKGDYWKIDNITIGYNFRVAGSKHIKAARIYISSLNSFTITGYKGLDPEVNQIGLTPGYDDREKYPTARVFSAGMNITIN